MKFRSSLGIFALVILFPLASLPQSYPEPVGYVNDFAGVISAEYERKLTELAKQVDAKTTAEISIATVQTALPQSIDMYAVELFTRWGIGKKGKDNGVLIVLAIDEKRVWIEVGYGLEGPLPDGFSGEIYRQFLKPKFAEGKFGEGLWLATTNIARKIGEEYGVEIGGVESVPPVKARPKRPRFFSFLPILIILFIIFGGRLGFLPFLLLLGLSGRRGYWSSGTFGGGGGFSGGFGGFGGGSCGGGGAGGGW